MRFADGFVDVLKAWTRGSHSIRNYDTEVFGCNGDALMMLDGSDTGTPIYNSCSPRPPPPGCVAVFQKKKLDIKRDPSSGIVSVDGACVLAAENSEQLRTLLDKGLQSRKMASTKMNDQSSRSHLIFSILVQNYVPATNTTTTGKMTFVDLAGSERVARYVLAPGSQKKLCHKWHISTASLSSLPAYVRWSNDAGL